MRRWIFHWGVAGCVMIMAAVAISFFGGVTLWKGSSSNSLQSSQSLRNAPEFRLLDFQGRPHSLSEWRGQWVLLHFWASWCPPCLGEIPHWQQFAKKLAEHSPKNGPGVSSSIQIRFVSISFDEKWEDAEKILPTHQLESNMVSLIDPQSKTSELYGTFQFPETYLLSPDQRIVTKWVGPQEWTVEKLLSLIEQRERVLFGSK